MNRTILFNSGRYYDKAGQVIAASLSKDNRTGYMVDASRGIYYCFDFDSYDAAALADHSKYGIKSLFMAAYDSPHGGRSADYCHSQEKGKAESAELKRLENIAFDRKRANIENGVKIETWVEDVS